MGDLSPYNHNLTNVKIDMNTTLSSKQITEIEWQIHINK